MNHQIHFYRFNPAEAEEWFRSSAFSWISCNDTCFNPAEAEEWFRSLRSYSWSSQQGKVSIQPKPKNGLEVEEKQDIGDKGI